MPVNFQTTRTSSSSSADQEARGTYYGRGAERGGADQGYVREDMHPFGGGERANVTRYDYGDERRWTDMADTRTFGALALGALLGLGGSLLFNAQPSRMAWRGSSDRARSGRRATRSSFVEHDETTELIASNKVEGTAVYNREGEKLGQIENFMVGKRSGRVAYAIMSFGGLLGIGHSHYPLPWNELDYDAEKGGYVVDLDEDRLREAPSFPAGESGFSDPEFGTRVTDYWSAAGSTASLI